MKNPPMDHQADCLAVMENREAFAILFEQGCGKTYTLLADFERAYIQGRVNALLILAPKGVHMNWILEEIPKHLEGKIIARYWTRQGGKKKRAWIEDVFKPRKHGEIEPMRILAMNYDALGSKESFDLAMRFVNSTSCMIVGDESQKIKNPAAMRTKKAIELRKQALLARILSGTFIANGPMDAFSQFEFLESGLLGTTSFRAFTAEYAVLLDNNSHMKSRMIQKNPRIAHAQIIAKDETGMPMYRNLKKLQTLVQAHSYRVLKTDCLDLPPKIRQKVYFELTVKQQAAYDYMKKKLRFVLEDGEEITFDKLPAVGKLKQITSGFMMANGSIEPIDKENPRLEALREIIEETEGQFIIWAIFREEHDQICALLKEMEITHCLYRGGVGDAEREDAKVGFQSGKYRAFVANASSAGTGLTLTAATTAIYYSCDYNVDNRKQSEDRCHRIGTTKNVVYIDLIAQGTVDENVADALRKKIGVAVEILGDDRPPVEYEHHEQDRQTVVRAAELEYKSGYSKDQLIIEVEENNTGINFESDAL